MACVQMSFAVEEVRSTAAELRAAEQCTRRQTETRALEMGADVLSLHELVGVQIQEFKDALREIERSQDALIESAVQSAVQAGKVAAIHPRGAIAEH